MCFAAVLQVSRFSAAPQGTDVTYKQLKQLLAGRTSAVIDVREPWELREYGFIPGAINVPRKFLSLKSTPRIKTNNPPAHTPSFYKYDFLSRVLHLHFV